MLISSHAAHDCQIGSNFYKQSGNTDKDFNCTETKGDVVIEMSGKYDFTVTREVIEMMEAESKVIVNWSYNHQILKGSSDKYNLDTDYVKVLHKRVCSSIGTIVTGFTKQQLHQHQENAHSSMHTLASKDTNGTIGHLFLFKK